MKYLKLLMIVLFFSINNGYSQKCEKRLLVETDEFTGNYSVFSEAEKIYDPTGKQLINELFDKNDRQESYDIKVLFGHTNKKTYIIFRYHTVSSYTTSAVEFAYLKLENDSIIKLSKGKMGDSKTNNSTSSFKMTFFEVSNDDISKIANFNIVKYRLKIYNNDRDPLLEGDLKENVAIRIKELANCFYNKIQNK